MCPELPHRERSGETVLEHGGSFRTRRTVGISRLRSSCEWLSIKKASFTAAIKLDQTLSELVHAHIMSDHASDKETGEIPQKKGAVAL
jgi:hypothetical protein